MQKEFPHLSLTRIKLTYIYHKIKMSDIGDDNFGIETDYLGDLGSGNDPSHSNLQQNYNDVNRYTSVTDNILGTNAFGNNNDH